MLQVSADSALQHLPISKHLQHGAGALVFTQGLPANAPGLYAQISIVADRTLVAPVAADSSGPLLTETGNIAGLLTDQRHANGRLVLPGHVLIKALNGLGEFHRVEGTNARLLDKRDLEDVARLVHLAIRCAPRS